MPFRQGHQCPFTVLALARGNADKNATVTTSSTQLKL